MATIELTRALNIRHVPEELWAAVRSKAKASGMTVQQYAQRTLAEAPIYRPPAPSPGEGPASTETPTT